ncbi:MAG: hypothetical protein HY232_14945 [Acidobacteria bacterium]|nr:hypothetical protein [Acidobacteriota bacterium]
MAIAFLIPYRPGGGKDLTREIQFERRRGFARRRPASTVDTASLAPDTQWHDWMAAVGFYTRLGVFERPMNGGDGFCTR